MAKGPFRMKRGASPTFKDLGSSKPKTKEPKTKEPKTKEQLIAEGFTPADADQMIKEGATTGVVSTKVPAETVPKNKKTKKTKK